jgi:hypothetical protein
MVFDTRSIPAFPTPLRRVIGHHWPWYRLPGPMAFQGIDCAVLACRGRRHDRDWSRISSPSPDASPARRSREGSADGFTHRLHVRPGFCCARSALQMRCSSPLQASDRYGGKRRDKSAGAYRPLLAHAAYEAGASDSRRWRPRSGDLMERAHNSRAACVAQLRASSRNVAGGA